MTIARVQWPDKVSAGEVVKVRMLIQHPMDTGYLQDLTGKVVPRNVIRLLTCTLNNQEVFRAEPTTGIAANPLFEFYLRAVKSGELHFRWVDDKANIGEMRHPLVVQLANSSSAPKP
jgi:sulfur-oxidizing protein SoxZ